MIEYNVTIIEIDDEDVWLDVNGIRFLCFNSICPYGIEVGRQYLATFNLFTLDDIYVREVDSEQTNAMVLNGESYYGYTLVGTLDGDVFDCGIKFQDPVFAINYLYLSGKKVQLKVYRIDADFLSKAI